MVILLEQSSLDQSDLSVQALNHHFVKVQDMPSYDETDRAYSNITSSGSLGILQNKNLRDALAKYYSRLKQVLVVQNTHELELVETFQPYIIENMDYQAVLSIAVDAHMPPPSQEEDRILKVLKDRKFRNVLTQKWVIANDLMNEYDEFESLRKEVITILKSELKRS